MELLHHRAGEMPRRNTLLEQNIQLSVRPALGLREAEERPQEAEETCSSVEETALCAPVPRTGVQHAGREHVADDRSHVVEVAGEDDGLLAEAGGWDLGDDGVADGADGAVVDRGEEQQHGADAPLGANVAFGDYTEAADDDEEEHHGDVAADVERAAANAGDECPGDEDTDGADGVLAETHGEGVGVGEAGLLEEVG